MWIVERPHGALFPHLKVADNVAAVPRLLGWDKAKIGARVNELLELVGLDPAEYGRRFPAKGQENRAGNRRGAFVLNEHNLRDVP